MATQICPSESLGLTEIFNTTLHPITIDTTLPYIILICIAFTFVTANCILAVFNFVTLVSRMNDYDLELKYAIFWNLSLFTSVSIVYLLMLIFLRAAIICQLLAEMMLAFAVYQFLNLLMIMHGGKAAMIHNITGTIVTLFPLCWCYWCKRRRVESRNLIVYNILIAQMVVVVPGVDFLGIVIYTENPSWYNYEEPFSPYSAYLYLNLFRVISFMAGNSSLTRMVQANWYYLKGTRLLTKYILLILVLNSVFIFRLLISFLGKISLIKCTATFPLIDIMNQIHAFSTILIMLIAGIIARLVYITFPGSRMLETHRVAVQTKDIIEKSVNVQYPKDVTSEEDPFVTPYGPN
ncbi:hypothetical protein LOD99_3773 [Oopsacas minuta]|uniref:Uncharacterized protein n=1 Tax=Oopsacas minuta TaxID=111878 RepID=A0AAV7JW68_9METZ|nr:hypothetical protein LOD99_3773 [Oopsacas minuta]